MPSDLGIRSLLVALDRHRVHYIVIGAVAAIAQGYPLTTNDLDVTPDAAPDNIQRLVLALDELDAKLRTPTESFAFPIDAKMIAGAQSWTLATTEGALDLVFVPAGTHGYEDLRRDALTLNLGTGSPTLVASLRDVIRMKEASNREKDRAQLPALRRTLELIHERDSREPDG